MKGIKACHAVFTGGFVHERGRYGPSRSARLNACIDFVSKCKKHAIFIE